MPRSSDRLRRLPLGTQAAVALIVLLLLVVLASLVTSALVVRRDLEEQYEQRALAVARGFATSPGLARTVTTSSPEVSGPVQRRAEAVRRRTRALYVVVTDDRGIRYSHPTPGNVGKMVSTSPRQALGGREVVGIDRGTLGSSARGKVPLRDDHGRVVGEVSVGIAASELDEQTRRLVVLLALVTLAPLAIGVVGAVALARRLRRTTLGLEPEEMADLLREHAAVLGGVRDAVVALDRTGRVTVANPQAERLLGIALRRGVPLAEAGAPPEVVQLFEQRPAPDGALRVVGGTVVLATRLVVQRDGRDLGEVLILRDRSDLDHLARELEATRALTDALRAQSHEHRNRLHALTGMLHHGAVDDARDYVEELTEHTTWVTGLEDPYLAGLLAAKAAAASEAGVRLLVSEATWVEGRVRQPLDVVTVVGNLVDNAVRAAEEGVREPRCVEVTLVSAGDTLVVHVVDSGDGIPPASVDRLFDHGFTTRAAGVSGHGIGLSLARHTARAHGGEVRLVDPGGPGTGPGSGHGAAFEARLTGALDERSRSRERSAT